MTTRRVALLRAVAGWLAVVVLTALVTTLVVTRVGQDVAGELEQPLPGTTSDTLALPTAPASGSGTTRTPGPSDDAGAPTGTRAPAAGSDERPTPDEPAPTSGDVTTELPGRTPTGPTPTPEVGATPDGRRTSSTPSTTAGTAVTTASFSAEGGVVRIGCRGRDAQVRAVAPHNGYRFEVEAEGPTAHVHFTNGSREDEIEVSCRSGRPVRSGTGSTWGPGDDS